MTASLQFEEIIAKGHIDDLLPFFQNLDKKDFAELKKELKRLHKYYIEYIELKGSWNYRGNTLQRNMLSLSFLVLCQEKEFSSLVTFWDFFQLNEIYNLQDFLAISKPTWLTSFLDNKGNGSLNYSFLRKLYERGFIDYNEGLFARSIANLNSEFSSHNYNKTSTKGSYKAFEALITGNENIYKKDLPLIFEHGTQVNYGQTGHWDDKAQKYVDADENSWKTVIIKLIELTLWNKQETLQKCLETLKKDWKKDLLAWYRDLYLSLSAEKTELIALQSELCYLLSVQNSAIVNFAVTELKKISVEKDFDNVSFLEMSVSVLHRSDCKTAIKTILGIYEKMALSSTENRNQICQNACNCLLIDDLTIQEKALKIIATYGEKDNEDLLNALLPFANSLKGDLKKYLSDFSNQTENEEEVSEIVEKYEVLPQHFERIRADNALQIPDNWNDFMFHIGKVLSAKNLAIDIEIFLQAFDNLYDTFPADYKTQLQPYQKQIENWVSSSALRLFNHFLQHWLSDDSAKIFKFGKEHFSFEANLSLLTERVTALYNDKLEGKKQPTLSAITHAPHWISPTIFVERLLWYQERNIEAPMNDKCAAICRVALENCESALLLATKLNEKERVFIEYFLGNRAMPTLTKANLVSQSIAEIGNALKLSLVQKHGEKAELYNIYTILAARTKNPSGYFPEFEGLLSAKYINVLKPFELEFDIVQTESRYKDWQNKEIVQHWSLLEIKNLNTKESQASTPFLYSFMRQSEMHWQDFGSPEDFETRLSFIPNFSDPFYFCISSIFIGSDSVSERNHWGLVALQAMFEPTFFIRKIHIFFISQMTMYGQKENRALTTEILIHTIQNQSLNIDLLAEYMGKLISLNYAGLQRPLDVLAGVKDVSPLHNIALKAIYEGIFGAVFIEKEIPKNTKKLLEDYFDILIKTKSKPNENLVENLKIWSDNATLKKIAQSVLDLGGVKIAVQKRQTPVAVAVETLHATSLSQQNSNIRKFIFSEGTSNKFWQIACSELSFTVTFGKVGTAGQQQTKTFNSPEACQKEAAKLVAEKVKKGYLEQF